MLRLVEHGQCDLGEIDDLHVESAVLVGVFGDPSTYGEACAAGSCAADDHLQDKGSGGAQEGSSRSIVTERPCNATSLRWLVAAIQLSDVTNPVRCLVIVDL
jgi:hypothetical protein